jgi:hypothetical protein
MMRAKVVATSQRGENETGPRCTLGVPGVKELFDHCDA